jgi:hypothetical protein
MENETLLITIDSFADTQHGACDYSSRHLKLGILGILGIRAEMVFLLANFLKLSSVIRRW